MSRAANEAMSPPVAAPLATRAVLVAAVLGIGCASAGSGGGDGPDAERCAPWPADAATTERVFVVHRIRGSRPAADGTVVGLDLDGDDAARCDKPDDPGAHPGDLRGVDARFGDTVMLAGIVDQHFRDRTGVGRGVLLVRVTEAPGHPATCPRVEIMGGAEQAPAPSDVPWPAGRLFAALPPSDHEHVDWQARDVRRIDEHTLEVALGDVELPTHQTGNVRIPWPVHDARLRLPRDGDAGRFLFAGALDVAGTIRMLEERLDLDVELAGLLLDRAADLAPNAAGDCQQVSVALVGEVAPARWLDPPGE